MCRSHWCHCGLSCTSAWWVDEVVWTMRRRRVLPELRAARSWNSQNVLPARSLPARRQAMSGGRGAKSREEQGRGAKTREEEG